MRPLKFLALYLFSFFNACNNNYVPERVKGVPESAFWAGGPDGGNWFLIKSIDSSSKSAVIEVYYDSTGELIVNKTFTLHCNSDQVLWNDLKSQIDGFDGTRIFLTVKNTTHTQTCYFE